MGGKIGEGRDVHRDVELFARTSSWCGRRRPRPLRMFGMLGRIW